MELKNVKIIMIGKLQEFNSGFTKVDFVVETQEDYPQTIILEAHKEKADNLIQYNKVGDFVDVSYNLRGRSWVNPEGETKYFNSIVAWKTFKAESATTESVEVVDEDDSSGLPF